MIDNFGVITSGNLKGVTANRNIAAFSIALKIPFVLVGLLIKCRINKRFWDLLSLHFLLQQY